MAADEEQSQKVYLLRLDDLSLEIRNQISKRDDLEYFFSQDWSPEFYREQARLGFIAITYSQEDFTVLMPQLQSAYAVLDWKNLHISRKVRQIIKSGRLEKEQIRLRIESNPDSVLDNLNKIWKESTWLTEEYRTLIRELASPEQQEKDKSFRIWGIALTAGEEQFPVAGELGYTIGKCYTSLSGFFNRDNRAYNNFGKLQMVLLAWELKSRGISFWNLGHPYMQYKTDLGAVILPREQFLPRWDEAVKGVSPDLSLNPGLSVHL